MDFRGFVIGCLVFSYFAAGCYGVTLSSLQMTLKVTAFSPLGHDLKAGEDDLTLKWELDSKFPSDIDSSYKTVKLKLCYGRESQEGRPWRKTVDDLKKDKTCQHTIVQRPYSPTNNSFVWTVERDIALGKYFVRAYVYNDQQIVVAYGQNTGDVALLDLYHIIPITGRHASIDVASICFSVFSVVSLVGFFYMESRKTRTVLQK
ncbi:high-affinity nitrate transporter [Artemisia annua]|uniref:High-affinity nitrate transporter n=1 Tax=Artemisia annua TaxID=35608 RepID=A0A2U1MJB1_ARTAN|nr:high-affinity nitrate transporter [Artemisia annua]